MLEELELIVLEELELMVLEEQDLLFQSPAMCLQGGEDEGRKRAALHLEVGRRQEAGGRRQESFLRTAVSSLGGALGRSRALRQRLVSREGEIGEVVNW